MKLKEGIRFIDSIEELSAIPAIALELVNLLNLPTTGSKEIVEKIQLDIAISSYVLKCCNSPAFSVRENVSSIRFAVNLLGINNLKSILTSYVSRSLFNQSQNNQVKDYLWEHSIAVAVLAKNLAISLNEDSEAAYMAGLLHDIGKMVLNLHNPKAYQILLESLNEHPDTDCLTIEKDTFEFTHTDAGYFLLEKWQFPKQLQEVVLNHHEFELFEGDDKMIGIVSFANSLAHFFVEKKPVDLDRFIDTFRIDEGELDALVEESMKMIDSYHSSI